MKNGEDAITGWFAQQSKACDDRFPIGIGDDMAMVRMAGGDSVLITTDMLLEGTHFDLENATIEQVGYKSMAVSLSDCAAMATLPVGAVVSVGLPKGFDSERLKELHAGIVRAGDKYGCELIGGDITSFASDGKLVINVAMLSRPCKVEPVRRSGAKVGDVICVTGKLGGSLRGGHLEFEPRVFEAVKIAESVKLNSMMDISDGLSRDLPRICAQSGVGALVYGAKVPISAAAKESGDPLAAALNDGEDFELLFTLSEEMFEKLKGVWKEQLAITAIGKITQEKGVRIDLGDGNISDLKPEGFDHLA